MGGESQRPPFLAYLAREPIRRILKQDFLGRLYVLPLPFITTTLGLYATGVALGHARRDRFETLVNLFFDRQQPEQELNSVCHDLGNLAQKRLDDFRADFGGEPDTFSELFVRTEFRRAGLDLDMPPKHFEKAAKLKLFLKMDPGPTALAEGDIMEGIGFGATLPQLTESLWQKGCDTGLSDWRKWRERGLALAEQPTVVTLEDAEQEVLRKVAAYASEYCPQLVEPLGLHSA